MSGELHAAIWVNQKPFDWSVYQWQKGGGDYRLLWGGGGGGLDIL
jgi:hypothetical protein